MVFQIVGLGQTTETCEQPEHFTRTFSAEQANSRHSRSVFELFEDPTDKLMRIFRSK